MQVRLLGPVRLRTACQVLEVGPPKQRGVFAVLTVEAGRPVTVDTLVDRVWDRAPGQARAVVYAHVTRLRRVLAEAAVDDGVSYPLVHRNGAYLLEIDRDQVDLHRFRRLIEQARGRPDDEQSALLGEALGLWRGVPFTGLSGSWIARLRDSCHRQRLEALVAWARVELRRGDPGAVIDQIHDLTGEYPLVEPLTAVLMRALYVTGHTAEALNRYAAIRRRLAEELGADPGPELQKLHQTILRNDDLSSPPPVAAAQAAPPAAREVPAQLPADVGGFTGRVTELAQLDAILAAHAGQPTAVVVAAVCGSAGVGKTALAVHWAHRVADRFPDGQLYVNLRGFDPAGQAMNPAEAIRGFLDAFAVPPQRIPASLDGQAARYRSIVAGRKILVVLDNARDADQVRPLLPGSPGCLVVVTSRDQLTGLVAEGAHPLTLDLLAPAEARDLLAHRLGTRRVAAEPRAANKIIELCARLPLALAIVAARAATNPAFPLAALADELREHRGGLNAFDGADAATGVRAVFSWSYHSLGGAAARLFRLLGLHPGPDLTVPAAASLCGAPEGQVRPLLAELARAHLVTQHAPGRYTFHDLLRAYAMELANTHDSAGERHEATGRMLDHYLRAAHAADRLLRPYQKAIALAAPHAGLTPEKITGHRQALAWFSTEHAVLLAAVDKAAATGFDTHAWQLAWTLTEYFDRRGHWHDWAASQRRALHSARRLADPVGQAHVHRDLGRAYAQLGRLTDAECHLGQAAELFARAEDPMYRAYTHHSLGGVLDRQGRHQQALRHARQALELFRAADDKAGQANALAAIGWYHVHTGHHDEAVRYCRQALAIQKEIGDARGQAGTWHDLGDAHRHLGQHRQAIRCYRRCIGLYRDLGDLYYRAMVLDDLGDTCQAVGQPDAARDAWRRALDILQQLDHHRADGVRAKLSSACAAPR